MSIENALMAVSQVTPYSMGRPTPVRTVTDFILGCTEKYFATLTSKRRHTSLELSNHVGECLHRVETRITGNRYRRKGLRSLATYVVHERSFSDGLHAHLLIGVPEGALSLKATPCLVPLPELLVATWCKLDPQFRRPKAQDVRVIHEMTGAVSYLHKTIWRPDDFDAVDLANTHIPRGQSADSTNG